MEPENVISLNQVKQIRADAARNRRLLLDTALKLFEQYGVADVTMSAIAKEANVGKGTLYRHFADKAELCHALLDEDMLEFQRLTLESLRKEQDAHKSLIWFLSEAAIYVVNHSVLLREVSNEGGVDMIQHPAHLWWRQTIYGLLLRLKLDGDVSYMADVLYMMLDVQTIRMQRQLLNYDIERITAGLHMTAERLILL